MALDSYPELRAFFSTYLSEADPGAEAEAISRFLAAEPEGRRAKVREQLTRWMGTGEASPEGLLEALGMEANRWFGDADEAHRWLAEVQRLLTPGDAAAGPAATVRDSNGAALAEGDSVLVIKDLKVKGGSSDLKRGTLIRKIHLTDDAEAVECRVDGSTLVLKTCFLKKA